MSWLFDSVSNEHLTRATLDCKSNPTSNMAINGYANGHTNGVVQTSKKRSLPTRRYSVNTSINIAKLKSDCAQTTDKSDYPHCKTVLKNIPVYDLSSKSQTDSTTIDALQEEWHHILHQGPGVFVLKHFYPTTSIPLIDRVNQVFDDIIASEASNARGDHFAASNANSRIWNSLQKHAITNPASFVEYYSNPWLRHVSEAWLGPGYTVTAQVNIVRPSGKPQMPHRDYHLGFQTAEQCARWPKTMHATSQFLTLQGAVAHSDMPLESGPTRLLPYSQLLEDGYMAWRSDEVKEYFAANWVSLPLEKGDGLFFNPALIHAAGENLTEPGPNGVDRSANLLQISSAFGKTMEKIDFDAIVTACWDDLLAKAQKDGPENMGEVECAVRAMTDGYPFPTNLDKRPPAPGGMAPESQTEIVLQALQERRTREEVIEILRKLKEDSSA